MNTNTTHRFKRIKLRKMQNVIWVENMAGGVIPPNSRMYCGCCGHMLGTVRNEMKFPFDSQQLIENTDDRTFQPTPFGLHHRTCGIIMFTYGSWHFVPLLTFFLETKDLRETEKLLREIPVDQDTAEQ